MVNWRLTRKNQPHLTQQKLHHVNNKKETKTMEKNQKRILPLDAAWRGGKMDTKVMPGREMMEKRTRSSKTFDLGRGARQFVLYPQGVHYEDESGTWKDIDNSLKLRKGKVGEAAFVNQAGPLAIQFAQMADAKQLVKIEDGHGRYLSWNMQGIMPVMGVMQKEKAPRTVDEDERRRRLPKHSSSVLYENVFADTDLVCRLAGESFKDDIRLKSMNAPHTFTLAMQSSGLALMRKEDGTIQAFEEGVSEAVFTLPPAFMYDAQGKNGMVETRLEQAEEGYRIVMTCDEAFLAQAAFPVTVDPIVHSVLHSSAMQDNYVTKLAPNDKSHFDDDILRICNNTSYGECRSYLKFTTLPGLSSSDTITKAYLTMSLYYAVGSQSVPVHLKEVTSDWESSGIYWNYQPTTAAYDADYVIIPANSAVGSKFEFDISNLVRKWYAGTNYGVMLERRITTTPNTIDFGSSDSQYHKPQLTINYVSNAGLEDYMTFESHDCGRAGTAHVNLFNGNLVVSRPITRCTGSRMPVSIDAYYNSEGSGFTVGMGMGWRLSCDQNAWVIKLGDTLYYVINQGDGTQHYFLKPASGAYFEDLSGLSLRLQVADGELTVTDKAGTVTRYEEPMEYQDFGGKIKSISDASGNTATFSYSGEVLRSITDGAGRVTALTYDGNGQLTAVLAPGETVPVTFSNIEIAGSTYLASITDVDAQGSQYSYADLDPNVPLVYRLSVMSGLDGHKLQFGYTAAAPYRVIDVSETGGLVQGNHRAYVYGDCMTTVRDMTVATGKRLIYQFNDWGNVVSVRDDLGYASYTKFNSAYPPNHPETTSKLQRSVVNLLPNHDFELDDYWSTMASGGTGTMGYATDQKYMGTRSMKLDKTNSSGDLRVYMEMSTLVSGKTYTLSAYIRSSGSANCYATANCGGSWYDGDKVTSVGEWTRIFTTFTATATSATLYFITTGGPGAVWLDCAQLEESAVPNRYNLLRNGDFSQSASGTPVYWSANGNNTTSDAIVSTADTLHPTFLSSNCMRMYGNPLLYKGIYQDLPISGVKDDVFVVGGWAKGFSRPIRNENRRFCIRVTFKNSAGNLVDEEQDNTRNFISWNEEWTDWQYISGAVAAPFDYTGIRFNVDYELNLNYADFDGLSLYKEEFGNTFSYDEKGNILAVKDLVKLKSSATYDSFDNLTSYVQPGRAATVKTTLEYGATEVEMKLRLVKKSTNPMGVVQAFQYDSKGNPTVTKTQNSNGASFIQGTTAYTANQNYVASQTDARGMTVTSNIDLNRGTLSSVTDPKGQTVGYTYDTLKRVTATTAAAEGKTYKNEYVYAADKLTQVKHNTTSDSTCDVVYSFAYDALGNPTTVKVGDQALSTNVYSATGDKLLSRVEYGNGGQVSYTRDAFKRVTGVRFDNEGADRYQYAFDANGQTAQVTDNNLSRITTFECDAANRPMRVRQREGAANLYTSTLGYDAYSNLSSFKEKVESAGYETTYAYDDGNRPTAVQFGSAANRVGYTYDALGRVSARTLTVGGTNYATAYGFETGGQGSGSTTALVNDIIQSGQRFTYTYDNVGNITSVDMHRSHNIVSTYQTYLVQDIQGNQVYGDVALTQPVSVQVPDYPEVAAKIFYHYDDLGQLKRVDDPYDKSVENYGTTWVYTYDRGGNIFSKTKYVCTNGALGTPMGTYNYTYDATWKDKLIAYRYDDKNYNITYDNIGNPLNDDTWQYTWQAGRQLKSMTSQGTASSTEVAFNYNADGLRVRKAIKTTVNGTQTNAVTDYTLHGKQVVHLKKGGDNLHFFFDAQGRPAMVEWNGVKYGYVHNLQGDIVAIIDGGGNTVVEYTYDAWGKPLAKTGTLAATLGTLNPFRYRGYVFDEETGLYYLRSRYYNPVWGRFLNADSFNLQSIDIGDYNLFGYCFNKCISYYDSDGKYGQSLVAGWRFPKLSEQTQMELLSAGFVLPDKFTFVSETRKGNKKTVVLNHINQSDTVYFLDSPIIFHYTPSSVTTYTYTYRIERRLNLRDSYESARQNQDWKAVEFVVGEIHPLLGFLTWAVYTTLDGVAKFLPHTIDPKRLYYEKISENVVTKYDK